MYNKLYHYRNNYIFNISLVLALLGIGSIYSIIVKVSQGNPITIRRIFMFSSASFTLLSFFIYYILLIIKKKCFNFLISISYSIYSLYLLGTHDYKYIVVQLSFFLSVFLLFFSSKNIEKLIVSLFLLFIPAFFIVLLNDTGILIPIDYSNTGAILIIVVVTLVCTILTAGYAVLDFICIYYRMKKYKLSNRQKEVLQLYIIDHSTKEIMHLLKLNSDKDIFTHLERIRKKINKTRSEENKINKNMALKYFFSLFRLD